MTPRHRLGPNEARLELVRDSPIPGLGKATLTVNGKEMQITMSTAREKPSGALRGRIRL